MATAVKERRGVASSNGTAVVSAHAVTGASSTAAASEHRSSSSNSSSSRDADGGGEEHKGLLPPVVRYHDYFNLAAIAVLNVLNGYYLATGSGFAVFYWTTMAYFLADMVYVGALPQSVKSPLVILLHHIITALYVIIPYRYPKYEWCMAYCMLVEVNTWLLIAKRTFPRARLLEPLFYVTWVGLRNVWYPYLIGVFYSEWRSETELAGTPWNPIIVTPVLQAGLTGLNYYWTLNLLLKKKKQEPGSKQL